MIAAPIKVMGVADMGIMKAANRRKLYNSLMVLGVIIILAGAIMGVGSAQGWFGMGGSAAAKYPDAPIVVQNKIGYVTVERSGIAYELRDGDNLRDGDIIETLAGSSVELSYGDGTVEKVGEKRELKITVNEKHRVSLQYLNEASDSGISPAEGVTISLAEDGTPLASEVSGEVSGASSSSNSSSSPASSLATNPSSDAASAPTSTPKGTCTITIRCDTILNNMKDLEPGKERFVPSNGVILATSTVEFNEGDTVFEVLNRVCKATGIQIEYSWTPIYNSYYIEGINHLYEFDCGNQSGWMYQVNGWYPNYGCSSYTVSQGDVIEWNYTCNGLGADLGAPMH